MNDKKNITEQAQYYLCIDWGKARCGVAIADDEMRIASSLHDVATDEIFSMVDALARTYRIKTVVVGYPDESDQYSKKTQAFIEQFIGALEKKGFLVQREAEFFSTKMAITHLAQAGKRSASKHDNAEAARVILQGWLDKQVKK